MKWFDRYVLIICILPPLLCAIVIVVWAHYDPNAWKPIDSQKTCYELRDELRDHVPARCFKDFDVTQ